MAQIMLGALPATEYPSFNEVIVEHVLKFGFDYAEEFKFGLNLILDGFEKIRAGA